MQVKSKRQVVCGDTCCFVKTHIEKSYTANLGKQEPEHKQHEMKNAPLPLPLTEDEMVKDAIEESIMYHNINKARSLRGLDPLKPKTKKI